MPFYPVPSDRTIRTATGERNQTRNGRSSRDYRDNVIETLAMYEAAALRQLGEAEVQRDIYRQMVSLLLAQVHETTKQLSRLRDQNRYLREEYRQVRKRTVRDEGRAA